MSVPSAHCVCVHTCVCAGVRTVPVVSECKCVGGCYRLPHYHEFTVPAHSQEERGSGVAGQGQMEGHQRMVDVGRCAGSCPEPEPECIR